MKRALDDLLNRARHLETAMATGVDRAARAFGGVPRHDPLEVVHAILDRLEQEIQPAGRGRRAFPFNRIDITLAAATPQEQARLDVAVEGPPSLHDRLVQRLDQAGCAAPPMHVRVTYVAAPAASWSAPQYHLALARVAGLAPSPAAAVRVELAVTHGEAERSTYVFDALPITIGRGDEVRDQHRRLIRTNHVVFLEGAGEVNASVSRQHARIEIDPASGACRLFDDGSAHGTSVIRGGRGIAVTRGTRGLRLQSGDEIVLGQARMRVKTSSES